ncbi:MAG TPA: sulfatase-like hydrolase/transferase [Microvirga sp.]|jgi:arylsulfatase A-like enzyme|nr:sulfatase-like hydrolase/transferase [Microvirga sp.]
MARAPNIVVLIADDHRYESLGVHGCRQVRTPHLDALAAAGTLFDNAHCQGGMHPAVCVPCRASLMTGRNIFRSSQDPTGSDYEASAFWIPEELETFPQRLRRAGYRTHAVGKWHNDRAAFARSFTSADRIMFGGMSDHDRVPLHRFDPSGRYPAEAAHFEPGFSTDLFRASAEDFLRSVDRTAPFCLYVAFTAPHDPRTPPESHRVAPDGIELPPNLMPVHPFDNGEMTVRDEMLEAFPRTPDAIRRHIADYYGMIAHLDDAIGSILTTLEETGLAQETVVVYTADHGLALGQHGLLGKQNLYEHSLRIPLILRGPGVSAGRRVPHLVWHGDTNATLLEMAGLAADRGREGISLLALARGEGTPRRTFCAAYRFGQRMARTERYKFIRYYPQDEASLKPTIAGTPTPGSATEQLFDLASDPWEMNNLAFHPDWQEVRRALVAELAEWQRRVGDPLLDAA